MKRKLQGSISPLNIKEYMEFKEIVSKWYLKRYHDNKYKLDWIDINELWIELYGNIKHDD